MLILRRACWIWFQSTHPRGVRPGTPPGTACPISCFNPRTREGCDIPSVLGYVGRPSFNPRTREGCDPAGPQAGSQPAGVSIHAPARGATLATVLAVCWGAGFNPRTREGCDQRLPRLPARISAGFNPRTREGCDSSGASSKELPRTFQSTHPRGVRLGSRYGDQSFQSSFNPRTREGCDHMDEQQGCLLLKFQSTHPRGVRQSASAWQSRSSQFQSTHPRGVRHASRVPQADCRLVSIHAPARGATCRVWHPWPVSPGFNPRTREGCDADGQGGIHIQDLFQSTHPRGVRRSCRHQRERERRFQSTHPRGVRLNRSVTLAAAEWVSIHAPARGATCCHA